MHWHMLAHINVSSDKSYELAPSRPPHGPLHREREREREICFMCHSLRNAFLINAYIYRQDRINIDAEPSLVTLTLPHGCGTDNVPLRPVG